MPAAVICQLGIHMSKRGIIRRMLKNTVLTQALSTKSALRDSQSETCAGRKMCFAFDCMKIITKLFPNDIVVMQSLN